MRASHTEFLPAPPSSAPGLEFHRAQRFGQSLCDDDRFMITLCDFEAFVESRRELVMNGVDAIGKMD